MPRWSDFSRVGEFLKALPQDRNGHLGELLRLPHELAGSG
jgi:hypothetical protein